MCEFPASDIGATRRAPGGKSNIVKICITSRAAEPESVRRAGQDQLTVTGKYSPQHIEQDRIFNHTGSGTLDLQG